MISAKDMSKVKNNKYRHIMPGFSSVDAVTRHLEPKKRFAIPFLVRESFKFL